MKIFLLTHRIPWPPNRGDKIRSYHILKYLSAKHEVIVLAFSEHQRGLSEILRVLKEETGCYQVRAVALNYLWAKIRGSFAIFGRYPISVKAFWQRHFQKVFYRSIRKYKPDLVMTDSSALAIYPLHYDVPFVSDFMDVDSEKWRQYSRSAKWPFSWVFRLEAIRLRRFEENIAHAAKAIFLVSEKEKEKLISSSHIDNVHVVSTGIDHYYLDFDNNKSIKGRIVFTGVMDYFPNVDAVAWFCKSIFPRILKKIPDATFYIVGSDPSRKVKALGGIPGVEVTGSVPDVRPYLSQAQVVVAPLRFSLGLQNKVLEAMAMHKALVASPGAVIGLKEEARAALLVADSAKQFADSIIELLEHEEKRAALGQAARHYVETYHNWEENLKVLDEVLKPLARE